ncbi:MAG TPA: FAD-dependent oxidoreductase [Candidatus Dormibacteraeota bacterium]
MQATPSIWLDEPYTPRPRLEAALSCEVCVIGAGIAGLSAAWRLCSLGVTPVVLEGLTVAGGATGRNGGFFMAGVAPRYDEACRLWGRETAARRYRATLDAQLDMLAIAEEVGARDQFRLNGVLRVAYDAQEAERVREHHAAFQRDGFAGELLPEAALPEVLQRPGRIGLLTPHDGAVHPARWLRALARALEARGVRIYEGTRVLEAPGLKGSGVGIRAERGTVCAERVIVAADGALPSLVPAAAARVRARRLNMLATAPEDQARLPCPVSIRDGYEYVQQLPDGRVALGGFSDLDGPASYTDREELSIPVQERLTSYLREDLGVAAPVTHRWVGIVSYAQDPVPTCGPAPDSDGRILAAGGYNGTGHVQGFLAGRIAAELAVTGASPQAGLYAKVGS